MCVRGFVHIWHLFVITFPIPLGFFCVDGWLSSALNDSLKTVVCNLFILGNRYKSCTFGYQYFSKRKRPYFNELIGTHTYLKKKHSIPVIFLKHFDFLQVFDVSESVSRVILTIDRKYVPLGWEDGSKIQIFWRYQEQYQNACSLTSEVCF